MGKIFVEHANGKCYYECSKCRTCVANRNDLNSMVFMGATGPAYLFRRVVNIIYGVPKLKVVTTGKHWAREAFCKVCKRYMGWTYEFACEGGQKYKVGRTIIESRKTRLCLNGFENKNSKN